MKMTAFRLLLWMTLLTGIIYPLLITFIAQLTMPYQANGSLVYQDGKVIGSMLIGQKFTSSKYFWSRPSAVDYNPLPSAGSNLGPTSSELKRLVKERKEGLLKSHDKPHGTKVPSDLLFSSGSGLDPHISLGSAYFQIDRVAKARNYNEKEKEALKNLIDVTIDMEFKFLGPPTVNVLELNLALDKLNKNP